MVSKSSSVAILPRRDSHPPSRSELLGITVIAVVVFGALYLFYASPRGYAIAIEAVGLGYFLFRLLRIRSRR